MAPGKPTVLLLDDDSDFLDLERAIFEAAGFEVGSFCDPQAALTAVGEAAGSGRAVLIVCDLMMKTLDSGFSFARSIKAEPRLKHIPIIIVSAIASQKGFDFHPRTADDLVAMNADAFFDKPVQPQVLLSKAKELLARQQEPGT
ncbi:MAG TPA: response regulator [Spirochaetia bacterium]|nr:response regulator [Spirochaetia bacterium]